jgi:polyketide biosynthesis acyl carrier protein
MTKSEIFDIVIRHTREVIPGLEEYPFEHHDSLKALGANSMDRSEIVMMTLDSLSLKIPLVATAGAKSMGELVSVLHEKL